MRIASARRLVYRWLLPAASGALLAFALPPYNSGELGWLSLVPLLFAVEDCRLEEAFRRGYIAGLVFFGTTIWWSPSFPKFANKRRTRANRFSLELNS